MSDADSVLIPKTWCDCVSKILRVGDENHIVSTLQSRLDWEARFNHAWRSDLYHAMAEALETVGISGKLVQMREPGETYAFWFYYSNIQMYGKINLRPDGKLILIYSSHSPRKGNQTL